MILVQGKKEMQKLEQYHAESNVQQYRHDLRFSQAKSIKLSWKLNILHLLK